MTHAAPPAAGKSWWGRILELEPVRVQAAARAVLVLATLFLGGFGVAVPEGVEPWVIAVIAAFYAAVEAVTTALARRKSTPDVKVAVVVQPDGTVEAGPASLPTGTVIDETTTGPVV